MIISGIFVRPDRNKWLLDGNVLVALLWQNHIHHREAAAWFTTHRTEGWATCCLTELGFLRISMQATDLKTGLSFADVFTTLSINVDVADHEFWPLDYPTSEIRAEIRERIIGHQQLTDALLLDLAIRRGGRFATFDKGVARLLPPDSPNRDAIEILSVGLRS